MPNSGSSPVSHSGHRSTWGISSVAILNQVIQLYGGRDDAIEATVAASDGWPCAVFQRIESHEDKNLYILKLKLEVTSDGTDPTDIFARNIELSETSMIPLTEIVEEKTMPYPQNLAPQNQAYVSPVESEDDVCLHPKFEEGGRLLEDGSTAASDGDPADPVWDFVFEVQELVEQTGNGLHLWLMSTSRKGFVDQTEEPTSLEVEYVVLSDEQEGPQEPDVCVWTHPLARDSKWAPLSQFQRLSDPGPNAEEQWAKVGAGSNDATRQSAPSLTQGETATTTSELQVEPTLRDIVQGLAEIEVTDAGTRVRDDDEGTDPGNASD